MKAQQPTGPSNYNFEGEDMADPFGAKNTKASMMNTPPKSDPMGRGGPPKAA